MTSNSNSYRGRTDWEVIETWVITTPRATLSAAARKFDVSIRSVIRHGSSNAGRWIEKQEAHFCEVAQATDKRLEEILAQDRADNVAAIRELEKRLEKVCLTALELLFPPPEAPVEVHLAARKRLEEMSADKLANIINQGMRTLTETGRHRRLLAGESTAIFERAGSPDVLIPLSPEAAQALELQSRMAQQALKAARDIDSPIDIEGTEATQAVATTEIEPDVGL